jgi:hypothetical protein
MNTDKELLEEFTEAKSTHEGIALRVRTISWPEPHNPTSSWRTLLRLPKTATPAEIDAARQELLNNPKFFRICTMCHERNPCGWMHDKTICQSCAEKHLGVVY